MSRIVSGSMRYVVETDKGNADHTLEFMELQQIRGHRKVDHVNLAVAFFDEHENRTLAMVWEKYSSPPSDEFNRRMEYEFGPIDPDQEVVSKLGR